jgi:hypothetical protein
MSHAIKTSLTLGQDLQSRILTTATNPANWEVTTWWGSNRPFHGIGIGDYSFVDVDPEINDFELFGFLKTMVSSLEEQLLNNFMDDDDDGDNSDNGDDDSGEDAYGEDGEDKDK